MSTAEQSSGDDELRLLAWYIPPNPKAIGFHQDFMLGEDHWPLDRPIPLHRGDEEVVDRLIERGDSPGTVVIQQQIADERAQMEALRSEELRLAMEQEAAVHAQEVEARARAEKLQAHLERQWAHPGYTERRNRVLGFLASGELLSRADLARSYQAATGISNGNSFNVVRAVIAEIEAGRLEGMALETVPDTDTTVTGAKKGFIRLVAPQPETDTEA